MGSPFGLESNKTNAEDNRQAATDQAQVLRGSGNIGGLQLKNVKGDVILGDTDAMLRLTDKYNSSLAELLSTQQTGLEESLNAQSGIFKETLGSLAALAESKQTDGASGVNKNIVYIVAGVLVLAGFIFYFWKR